MLGPQKITVVAVFIHSKNEGAAPKTAAIKALHRLATVFAAALGAALGAADIAFRIFF